MRTFLLRAAVVAMVSNLLPSLARAITIVKDGRPTATIIVANEVLQTQRYNPTAYYTPDKWPKPAGKIRAAAEDLQTYIKKISGATLPIVSANYDVKGAVIFVGVSMKSMNLPPSVPQGVTKNFTEEGYRLYCKGDYLLLAGNDAGPYHGTEYAVYEFLNRLGVCWYMPGDYGEYLPAQKTITFGDVNFLDSPDFIQRIWWQNQLPEMVQPDVEFKLHNKMNPQQVISVAGDSSLRKWLPDNKVLTEHPEYFGKNPDGTVNPIMLNLTHPDVPALVAEKMKVEIRKQIDNGITVPQVDIAPDDGAPIDFTPDTMKTNLGFTGLCGRQGVPSEVSVSEEWFRFVNKVAELVTKDYPEALIASNGYANRDIPPEGITLHPNLGIEYAAIWADAIHALDNPLSWQTNVKGNFLRRWGQMNPRVYLYDYDDQMLVTGLTPVPGVRKLTAGMPLMKQWGLAGFLDEGRNAYMEEGIQTKYLRARMMWKAGLDVKATLDDYYQHWYGAAAAPAQAFWDDIEECLEKTPLLGHEDRVLPFVYTPELLAKLEKDIARAEAATTDERSKQHVRADRLILDHLKAYMAMHAAEFAGKYADAAKQADAMLAPRLELEKMSPFLCVTRAPYSFLISGENYWGATQRKAHYLKLDNMMNGKTGTLIAMAPQQVPFSLDPADIGRYERWYDAAYNRDNWQRIDTCKPFYLQAPNALDKRGVPYLGAMWYIFELKVPADAKGKPISLYSPIVVDDAWVWVNGTYVSHRGHIEPYTRPAELQCDVTNLIQPGKTNIIAVRVHTGLCAAAVADGFMGRLFLYSPAGK